VQTSPEPQLSSTSQSPFWICPVHVAAEPVQKRLTVRDRTSLPQPAWHSNSTSLSHSVVAGEKQFFALSLQVLLQASPPVQRVPVGNWCVVHAPALHVSVPLHQTLSSQVVLLDRDVHWSESLAESQYWQLLLGLS
jgi:hypothetical protein